MWIATWALNTLVAKGKSTDWMVHMLGQAVAAHTDATHGMTLAAVSMAYYRFVCPFGLAKFKRFAMNVWDVNPEGKVMNRLQRKVCRNGGLYGRTGPYDASERAWGNRGDASGNC